MRYHLYVVTGGGYTRELLASRSSYLELLLYYRDAVMNGDIDFPADYIGTQAQWYVKDELKCETKLPKQVKEIWRGLKEKGIVPPAPCASEYVVRG
jgi:hypothetical protein